MKIILPNAKELNTTIENHSFHPLDPTSLAVAQTCSQFKQEELASFYKISYDRAGLELDRWKRIEAKQAKTYPAWLLYDGLMYRYMDRRDLTIDEEVYLKKHVLLATALYGLISPDHLISPHRLDFQAGIKVEGKSLKQYWRPAFDKVVEEEDWILSLASSEFEQVFSPQIQKKLVRVTFMEEKDGKRRIHSTISKKGRGRLVSVMAKEGITELTALQQVTVDGFSYQAELSDQLNLVFVRKTN
ncbi:TPA: peroxide stress protein YaaA [Streptococcus suis]